jgi:hypothetical protein
LSFIEAVKDLLADWGKFRHIKEMV